MNQIPDVTGLGAGMAANRRAPLFAARFPATDDAVRHNLQQLQAQISAGLATINRCDDMIIVLAEVLNNVVEHATAAGEGSYVEVVISKCGGRLSVETRDDGRPLPPSLMTGAEAPDIDTPLEDLPEGGFGWFIIHSLVDDMMYEREGGQNLLSFSFAA